MNRRDFLGKATLSAAALACGTRLAAQVSANSGRDLALRDIAAREIQRAGATLWHRDVVGVADFGLHSANPRLHFVDLVAGRVDSYFVSHGDGSDPEHDGWLKWYSNLDGSHCTSKGAYMTRSWYRGKFGTSIRLEGLDPTNSNAEGRAIVMHPANYAKAQHVATYGKLGRSNGCFAMDPADFHVALTRLAGGRLLVAESLGLLEDGGVLMPPVAQLDLMRRDPPQGTFDRSNPGVY